MNTPAPKSSTLAVVALVLSILCPPIGLILGIIALVRINNSRGTLGGKGLALAAILVPVGMVPIIGILAAIAIPNFIRFQQRAKQSEAKTMLASIKTSQEAFYVDRSFYVRFDANPSAEIGSARVAWDNRPCPEACATEPAACNQAACIGHDVPAPVYYRYACETKAATDETPAEFTCVAVGDLDGDDELSVFVVGSANAEGATTLQAPVPALARGLCSGPIAPGRVESCTPKDAF